MTDMDFERWCISSLWCARACAAVISLFFCAANDNKRGFLPAKHGPPLIFLCK
jgi:hypothetical protein